MKLNQKGYTEIVTVSLILGIIGSLFIVGVFVWQKINDKSAKVVYVPVYLEKAIEKEEDCDLPVGCEDIEYSNEEYVHEKLVENIDVDLDQGVYGLASVGSGDCMPKIGGSDREYTKYTGKAYIAGLDESTVTETKAGNETVRYIMPSNKNDFEQTIKDSLEVDINDGLYVAELSVGSYVFLWPEYDKNRYNSNFITVNEGEKTRKDVKHWTCTVY